MASLAKQLDKFVVKNRERRAAVVLNFLGERTDEYTEKVAAFAEEHKLENIALTVTSDGDRFNIHDDAEVTVLQYRAKTVAFNYAVGKKGVSKKDIKAILKGTSSILD